MTARPIDRFVVIATYDDLDRPDHRMTYPTRSMAIDSAAFLHASGVPLRVWVREHSFDVNVLPKTIWRNGKAVSK